MQTLPWLRQLLCAPVGVDRAKREPRPVEGACPQEYCLFSKVGIRVEKASEAILQLKPAALPLPKAHNLRLSFPSLSIIRSLSLYIYIFSLLSFCLFLCASPSPCLSLSHLFFPLHSVYFLPPVSLVPSGADGMPIRASDRHVECGCYFAGAAAGPAAFPHRGFARGAPGPDRLRVRVAAAETFPSRALLFGVLRA